MPPLRLREKDLNKQITGSGCPDNLDFFAMGGKPVPFNSSGGVFGLCGNYYHIFLCFLGLGIFPIWIKEASLCRISGVDKDNVDYICTFATMIPTRASTATHYAPRDAHITQFSSSILH